MGGFASPNRQKLSNLEMLRILGVPSAESPHAQTRQARSSHLPILRCFGFLSRARAAQRPARAPYLRPRRAEVLVNRVARGGTQGGLNCLTHVLPRRLPTPTEEADGNGYGVMAGRRGPSRPPPRASDNLVPLLLTGVRLHPPGRTDEILCRCFGAPARRVFPDHLITWVGIRRPPKYG